MAEGRPNLSVSELLETIEDLVWQFGYRTVNNNLKRHGFTTGGLSALENAFYVLDWSDPHYPESGGCEYPGCYEWASCGTLTANGYKRCCGEHFRKYQEEKVGG